MAISPIPLFSGTPPNRQQSQADFNTNVANWVSYTTTIQTDLNTFGTQANALAVEVDGYKNLSLTYKNEAAASAASAANSESAASFAGDWSTLTGAATKPYSVLHNGSYWALVNNLANVALSEPSLTNSDWAFISGTRWQGTRTSSFTAAANAMHNATATSGVLDATLDSFTAGDFFFINNNPTSTQLVRVVKSGITVTYQRGTTVGSTDNITLRPGETFRAFAISSTSLVVY